MMHPDWLASFISVADAASFTVAAERLGLRQSTVSQHIRKLEAAVRRPVFARDTHFVALTADGAILLDYARGIVDLQRRAERHFTESGLRGRLRVGVSEDFAATRLPDVLSDFMARHAKVDLELTVAMSGNLYESLDGGEVDVILAKRRRGDRRGKRAWLERYVWAGRPGFEVEPGGKPVPLIAFPPPSVSRAAAIEALERAGRSWRIACTSASLSGLRAAALAGLGVMPHAERLLPSGLVALPPGRGLPRLGLVEFVVVGGGRGNTAAAMLAETLLADTVRLRSSEGTISGE